jgi:hypothetical protein
VKTTGLVHKIAAQGLRAHFWNPSGRLINFGASWPDFCARRDDTLFTSDNVTSFGSGSGLAA